MSWSRRHTIAALVAATGCGFEPVLAPDGTAAGLRGAFAYRAPNTRAGFALLRRLEERLGLPEASAYELRLEIALDEVVTGRSPARIDSRSSLVAEIRYELAALPTGEVVRRGEVTSFTGFSTSSSAFAGEVALAAAQERLMNLLADRIASELLASAADWRR